MVTVTMPEQGPVSNESASDLDGIILSTYNKRLAKELSLPFISVLGHPDPEDRLCADHIEPANDRIGVIAAKYFIDRGHRNVLAINPAVGLHRALETRIQYFCDTAQKYGALASSKEVPFIERDETSRLSDGNDIASVQKLVAEFQSMPIKPTGIFIPSDSHLVVIQKSFQAAGIKPGLDVEFLGCDNESLLLDGLDVRPATIDINPEGIARSAVNVLLQRISESNAVGKAPFQIVNIEPAIIEAGAEVRSSW
jgi:DNA-binding LacI/PurR family transcriptional regulator